MAEDGGFSAVMTVPVKAIISRRAVDNHLHQVYAKLGERGRRALTLLIAPDDQPISSDEDAC